MVDNPEVKRKLVTVKDAAVILDRSLASLWRDMKLGRLEVVRICGSTRITVASIDRLIADGMTKPAKLKSGVHRHLAERRERKRQSVVA